MRGVELAVEGSNLAKAILASWRSLVHLFLLLLVAFVDSMRNILHAS